MNNKTQQTRRFPIRFSKLRVGSKFRIFAEPSRMIRKSDDTRVYEKMAESWSANTADSEQAIILMPDDLVIPLTRGNMH